ncbi:hypothetical protein [Streptomyces sp. TLI_105]|uniref:hypothetical protein n=1 Tax=Streptomyces sp. TLI_105 TaxID=1881019 RepID=UPI000AFD2C8F|nr:hypothetical protein [Streptomyces sp. TLI_105]
MRRDRIGERAERWRAHPQACRPDDRGTFESGTTEPADILRNYLDLETGAGCNGFTLYTDTVADADFLYNPDSYTAPHTVMDMKPPYVTGKS